MSLDSSNAMLVASASSIIGFGFSYYAFKKLISDKYSKGQEHSNSVYYWCGFLAMIAVGQGFTTVLNEVFFAISNDVNIRDEAIVRGIFSLFFYPLLLALFAFVVSRFKRKGNVNFDEELISQSNTTAKSETNSRNFSLNSLLIFLALVFSAAAAFYYFNGNISISNEKKFEVSECITCRTMGATKTEDCSLPNYMKYFIVSDSKIVTYSLSPEGQPVVSESPSKDEKCIFNTSGKFSFVCSNGSVSEQHNSSFSKEFDGGSKFTANFKYHIFLNGDFRLLHEDKKICKMKG